MDNNYPCGNYNYNVNMNQNVNGCCLPWFPPPLVEESAPLMNQQIITSNGLFVIDNVGTVEQVTDVDVPNSDRWNIVTTNGNTTIQNVATGRYMALSQQSTATGIPIVTTTNVSGQLNYWTIRNQPQPPILPPPPVRSFIMNVFSRRPIEVPNNSSTPGVDILQGSLTSGNLAGQSFNIIS